MKNNIERSGHGIKCDNQPDCNWADWTIDPENWKDWLNVPCPECGSNLLTQADFDKIVQINQLFDLINEMDLPESTRLDIPDHFRLEMNGTGEFAIKPISEDEFKNKNT